MELRSEIKEYRAKLLLNDILHDMGFDDARFREDAEWIIHEMLQHNIRITQDNLVKASIFLAKSKRSPVSFEEIQMINQNGKGGDSWISLIPVIKTVIIR